jgi:hypothetical protein
MITCPFEPEFPSRSLNHHFRLFMDGFLKKYCLAKGAVEQSVLSSEQTSMIFLLCQRRAYLIFERLSQV